MQPVRVDARWYLADKMRRGRIVIQPVSDDA